LINDPSKRPTAYELLKLGQQSLLAEKTCLDNLYQREKIPNKVLSQNEIENLKLLLDVSKKFDLDRSFYLTTELIRWSKTQKDPLAILAVAQAYIDVFPVLLEDYLYILESSMTIDQLRNECLQFLKEIAFDLSISSPFDFLIEYTSLFYTEKVKLIAIEKLEILIFDNLNILSHQLALLAIYYACEQLNVEYKHERLFSPEEIATVYL
jgi:hypothetical protein